MTLIRKLAALAVLIVAATSLAGDNLLGTITTTASASVCFAGKPKWRYSVQSNAGAFYVAASRRSDGTGTAAAIQRADVTSVYVAQYALYDIDTTSTEPNICIYGIAGAVIAVQVYERTGISN